jgi:hypothetical protein
MKRTFWQEIKLFYQFISGTHWTQQEREVLV